MPASPPRPGRETPDNRQPPWIFISYRRADTRHVAGRLSDRLEERFPGAHVFMDVDTNEPGEDFAASIQDAVARCNVLIAMIGPHWLGLEDRHGRRRIDCSNDYVTLEIATALDRGIPVIPLLVDEAAMPRPEELPERLKSLSRRNAARLDHETFRTDIQRILPAVERAIQRSQRPRAAPTVVRGATPPPRPQELAAPPPEPSTVRPPSILTQQAPRTTSRRAGSSDHNGLPRTNLPRHQRPIPIYRAALRIGLWWVTVTLGLFICFGVTTEITRPTVADVAGAVLALLMLGGLLALVIWFLRREILAQRACLDRIGFGQEHPAGRPLSAQHIRRVVIGCCAACVILTTLMVISPPAPAPQIQAPADTGSQ
jgi:hypothetical protein